MLYSSSIIIMIFIVFRPRQSCGREDQAGDLELLEEEVPVGFLVMEGLEVGGVEAGEDQLEGVEEYQARLQSRPCLTPVWTGLRWLSSG